jgi:hypothetical protein
MDCTLAGEDREECWIFRADCEFDASREGKGAGGFAAAIRSVRVRCDTGLMADFAPPNIVMNM